MSGHVVMFSGGIGSWMTARRVIDQHGADEVTLLFADVKGDNENPHLGEDEDTYRFINEAAEQLGAQLVTLREGRSIWQVFHDNKFLGNSRLANCSKFLKQQPCREWLEANCDTNTAVYVGIDWTETHRLPAIKNAYLPYRAEAPLTDPPYLDKADMLAAAKAVGLKPPRLYAAGYPHNNCGGFCVRAGHAQFRLLLQQNRERYLFHEGEERRLREHLGKDVSVLRDRSGGASTPLTLRAFRERIDASPEQLDFFDQFDFGGCGCFTQDESQVEAS